MSPMEVVSRSYGYSLVVRIGASGKNSHNSKSRITSLKHVRTDEEIPLAIDTLLHVYELSDRRISDIFADQNNAYTARQ